MFTRHHVYSSCVYVTHPPTHTPTHLAHFLRDVIMVEILFHSVPFLIRLSFVRISCFGNIPDLQEQEFGTVTMVSNQQEISTICNQTRDIAPYCLIVEPDPSSD